MKHCKENSRSFGMTLHFLEKAHSDTSPFCFIFSIPAILDFHNSEVAVCAIGLETLKIKIQ